MSDLTNAVEQVRAARWKAWGHMANNLSDHHILSIELLRTHDNRTLAVFTVVKDRKPVQYVLQGDASGANLRALVTEHCPPVKRGPSHHVEALMMAAPVSPMVTQDGGVTADSIATGEPPIKQDPPLAIVSLGTSVMTTTFNLGEVATQAG